MILFWFSYSLNKYSLTSHNMISGIILLTQKGLRMMLKDLIIAISLANLCLIRGWYNVYFTLSPTNQYYMKYPSSLNHFSAVMLFVLLSGASFFIAITLVRRSGNSGAFKFARVAFLLVLTIPLNGILLSYNFASFDKLSIVIIIIFLLILLILLARLILYFHKSIFGILTKMVWIMFPLFLLNIFHTSWLLLKLDPALFLDKPLAKTISIDNVSAPRVLWLIFDEMGQQLTFENRPSTVDLPEIDRLKSQSFYANNAYPPAGWTELSLPSLISGEMASMYNPISPNELLIKTNGSDEMSGWSTKPDIFKKVYELGYNTKLIGWYHPYGRVIGSSLTGCSWYPHESLRFMSFNESLINQFEILLDTIPFVKHYRTSNQIYIMDLLVQRERINTYQKIMAEIKDDATNPDLGLILAHWPVPHPPGLYNRSNNDFSIEGGSYLDNLVLVDNTIGELRRAMEDAGTWESTTIIFTSDHWWRSDIWDIKPLWTEEDYEASSTNNIDHRIPFIIKLSGQNEAVVYSNVFNSIITHDLVLALLNKDISDANDLVEWINNNRTKWDMPDYK